MKIRIVVSALITALGISMATAQAMPFAIDRTRGNLIIPAADGCWLSWHRSANGGCSRDRYGLLGSGVEYVPGPFPNRAGRMRWARCLLGMQHLWILLVGLQLSYPKAALHQKKSLGMSGAFFGEST